MLRDMIIDGASRSRVLGRIGLGVGRPESFLTPVDSNVNESVKSHLVELNRLLGRSILAKAIAALPMRNLLNNSLTPKRIENAETWNPASIVGLFNARVDAELTLSQHMEQQPVLSLLKYEVQDKLLAQLDLSAKAALDGYEAISDYLIACAFYLGGRQNAEGVIDFILSDTLHGVKSVVNYAIVSAARTIINKQKMIVQAYDDDASEIVVALKAADISLSSGSFETSALAVINNFRFNTAESNLIRFAEQNGMGVLPPEISRPLLIQYIKHSPVPITENNVLYFLPLFISQIKGMMAIADLTPVDKAESDKDFHVDFLIDDKSLIQVSTSAVKCAAQLYYVMTLGDELEVFDVVNYFTHKYLIRGGIEIRDSRLRDDLQMYVFSNRFTDLKTNRNMDRTRPAERKMFYMQVFNSGSVQVSDDLIRNYEFSKLWKVLILESAKYIERAQVSFKPETYLSRQNVMQAVEDLQYNLSTHCTGMANVITPLIYAELNFVIQRIFMHPEILEQVVPARGNWVRVVETLYMGMKNMRPKATVLHSKAKVGHDILRTIADYDAATFSRDENFFPFITNVEAFITTQSILQETLVDALKDGDEEDNSGQNGRRDTIPKMEDASAVPGATMGKNEWDF